MHLELGQSDIETPQVESPPDTANQSYAAVLAVMEEVMELVRKKGGDAVQKRKARKKKKKAERRKKKAAEKKGKRKG